MQKVRIIFKIGVFISIFVASTKIFAQIKTSKDIEEVNNILSNSPVNSLVIFDVDHVLIMPHDGYTLSRPSYRKKLWSKLKKNLSEKEAEFLNSIVTSQAKWKLVDKRIINILKNFEQSNQPAMALTACKTGKLGIIENREKLRIKELNNLGIDFKKLSPLKNNFKIPELQGKYGSPLIRDGVIFTAEEEKGKILNNIFYKEQYYPKSIIFIDDKMENLKSVEKFCQKNNIKFFGIHYIAVSLQKTIPNDKKLEINRIDTLKKNKIWIPD